MSYKKYSAYLASLFYSGFWKAWRLLFSGDLDEAHVTVVSNDMNNVNFENETLIWSFDPVQIQIYTTLQDTHSTFLAHCAHIWNERVHKWGHTCGTIWNQCSKMLFSVPPALSSPTTLK